MKILYFDCFSGLSGDMILGALVDVGVPLSYLQKELSKLPLKGYKLTVKKEKRMEIYGKKVKVKSLIKKDSP